jgi:hypothetical protein
MASAGDSGTVKVDDRRSYIKIKTLRDKKPTEIHIALRKVCDEQTVDRSRLSRSATRFREGSVTIYDNLRTGRPKTLTDERIVKLMADFLTEDRRATCEEISHGTRNSQISVYRLLTKICRKEKFGPMGPSLLDE